MDEVAFIDADILFRYFAISDKKRSLFFSHGSTGIKDLDLVMNLIQEIEKNNQYPCISEYSILEIICTLTRLKSAGKIPRILKNIYRTFDVLPLNDDVLHLAWMGILFTKFSQIPLRGKKDGSQKGLGIGLYTANEIVKLHGGKLWVQSAGRDKGTIFHVELPLV